jgi:molybdenum cofactor guanylyltransferase
MFPHVLTAAAILTGGLARRFHGRDKSRLVVNAGSILEHQLSAVASLAAETFIVTSAARAESFATAGVPVVVDAHPGCGPLGAIVTALDVTDASALIVLAGDMPHVSAALLAALLRLHEAGGRDAAVPESARGLEPLCAVYARSARPALAAALASGDLSLQHALRTLQLGVMSVTAVATYGDPAVLFRNINAPEDL